MTRWLALTVVLASTAAHAAPLRARHDAGILPPGSVAVGLFSPIRYGLDELLELRTQLGWWALLSPNLKLRINHLDSPRLRLSSSVGLSTPTPAMRLLKGYLFPSWDSSDDNVGWFVVPELGVAASTGQRLVLTLEGSVAVGLGVGANAARPLDTYAPVELVFAPALNGHRVSTRAVADYGLLRWMRLRLELGLHAIGRGDPPRSPWMVQGSFAVDLAPSASWRLSAGVTWYNHDQHAQQVVRGNDGFWQRQDRRSNDVYPTLDVAWVR